MYHFILFVLLGVAEGRFGQEQVPIAAIGQVQGGAPGVAATIAGAAISDLLAGANACAKLQRGDQILAELGTGEDAVAAAIGMVAAEKNFNPFVQDVPTICSDPTLPQNALLRGITPMIDPAVDGADVANALSASTVATPLNADGKSVADLLTENGFTNFTSQDAAGSVVQAGQASTSSVDVVVVTATAMTTAVTTDTAVAMGMVGIMVNTVTAPAIDMNTTVAPPAAVATLAMSSETVITPPMHPTPPANDPPMAPHPPPGPAAPAAVASPPTAAPPMMTPPTPAPPPPAPPALNATPVDPAQAAAATPPGGNETVVCPAPPLVAAQATTIETIMMTHTVTESAVEATATASVAQVTSMMSAANVSADANRGAGVASTSANGADFGTCDPTMTFEAGRAGRKANEFTFQSNDPVIAANQQDALNPNIITNRICDELTNICNANDAAKAVCLDAKAQILALGTRDQTTADAWNALIAGGSARLVMRWAVRVRN